MESFLISNWQNKKKAVKKAIRDGFGQAILKLGEEYREVVALSADLISSTRLTDFRKKFPDRFFQIGVAEQNMVGIAAGLAMAGKVPFSASFATFCPGRCLDQIRVQVCLNKLNVKLVGSHAGLSHQADGPTAQATEDIAVMRSLPNMSLVYPADFNQMLKAVEAVFKYSGPVYLRMTREPSPVFIEKQAEFKIGQAQILKSGKDVTIISAGPLLYQALLASKQCQDKGIDCQVINLHTLKPIDKETIISSVKNTGCLVTLEDHQVQAGLGSAVAEVVVKNHPVPMEMLGLDNQFGKTARDYQKLISQYGLTSSFVVRAIGKVLSRKNGFKKN